MLNKCIKLRYSIDDSRDVKVFNQNNIKIPEEYKELVEHVE